MQESRALLAPDEPPPFTDYRRQANGPVLLVCEHAGRRIPRKLGTLGLSAEDRERHIAWDIGAAGLARELARRLDARLLMQPYSRLVCDCNRRPDVESFIVECSEDTPVPGNVGLAPGERAARIREVFEPFHRKVEEAVDAHLARGAPLAFVTIHSFTPVFRGSARPMHIGLLYNRDPSLAQLVGERLRREGDLRITDNEPYSMDDESDFTVPYHAERRALPYLEIEIRQDLLATARQQAGMAERLARALVPAVAEMFATVSPDD